jgi:hypothetical protein
MQVQDATVLLHGAAVSAVAKQKYANGQPTGDADGVVVTIMHEGGFASYKIAQKKLHETHVPGLGEVVSAIVRPYAIGQEGGRVSFGYSFVRYATAADLDQAGAALLAAASGK